MLLITGNKAISVQFGLLHNICITTYLHCTYYSISQQTYSSCFNIYFKTFQHTIDAKENSIRKVSFSLVWFSLVKIG